MNKINFSELTYRSAVRITNLYFEDLFKEIDTYNHLYTSNKQGLTGLNKT